MIYFSPQNFGVHYGYRSPFTCTEFPMFEKYLVYGVHLDMELIV